MAGASSRPGREHLATLVNQVGEILAQGEDSGTPSQHTELRSKLRDVLINLLNMALASLNSSSSTTELAVVLQLLKLTLDKVPHYLGGDDNSLILDFLERLINILPLPFRNKVWGELVDTIGRIFLRISETEPEQFHKLLTTFCDLSTGMKPPTLCIMPLFYENLQKISSFWSLATFHFNLFLFYRPPPAALHFPLLK